MSPSAIFRFVTSLSARGVSCNVARAVQRWTSSHEVLNNSHTTWIAGIRWTAGGFMFNANTYVTTFTASSRVVRFTSPPYGG
jgi:hypothetical protein